MCSPKIALATRYLRKKPCVTTRRLSSARLERNASAFPALSLKSSKLSPSSTRGPDPARLFHHASLIFRASASLWNLPSRERGFLRSRNKTENSTSCLVFSEMICAVSAARGCVLEIITSIGRRVHRSAINSACLFLLPSEENLHAERMILRFPRFARAERNRRSSCLQNELSVFVNYLCCPILEVRRHCATSSRDDVGMDRRIIESELFRLIVGEF